MSEMDGTNDDGGNEVVFTARGRGGIIMAIRTEEGLLFDGRVGPKGTYSDYLDPAYTTLKTAANFRNYREA